MNKNIVGLNNQAYHFLQNMTAIPDEKENIEDAFSGIPLYTMHTWHDEKTNETYKETIQDEPWDGDPTTYTCLKKVSDGSLHCQWNKKHTKNY